MALHDGEQAVEERVIPERSIRLGNDTGLDDGVGKHGRPVGRGAVGYGHKHLCPGGG
jgi:hypothetical protein